MQVKRIVAGEIATLDSNVYTGGGTDVTKELQAALDEAAVCGGVHLIMDGAALVTGLRVHSNTTIECLTKDCGFYQKDDSNGPIITNYNWDYYDIQTRNVTLMGGTYNQNCAHQVHFIRMSEFAPDSEVRKVTGITNYKFTEEEEELGYNDRWIYALEFYGVEHLTIRDLIVRNFRTFGVVVGGFRNVLIENVWLDLPGKNHMTSENQDGFHFWGPGQFLTMRNVGGTAGDDFINLGSDERDMKSSMTDIMIDGVFFDDADQGIRMLSRAGGTLERVTIRNVVGVYRSFGFYINPWFSDKTYGHYKDILFENIDMRQVEPNYDYRDPMLFSIGGNIENMVIKNVRHHRPIDKRTLFEIGYPFYNMETKFPEDNRPVIDSITIEDLYISEDGPDAAEAEYIQVVCPVERLTVKNVSVVRKNIKECAGSLISVKKDGAIKQLVMNDVITNGFKQLIDGEEAIEDTIANLVVTR